MRNVLSLSAGCFEIYSQSKLSVKIPFFFFKGDFYTHTVKALSCISPSVIKPLNTSSAHHARIHYAFVECKTQTNVNMNGGLCCV